MQLWAEIDLWEYNHLGSDFFDDFDIDQRIDRCVLKVSMIHEIGELETICFDSEMLHMHMAMFFKKWKVPIVQLLDTLEYDYNPLLNFDYKVTRGLGRDVTRDLVSAIKTDLESKVVSDEDVVQGSKRNITDSYSDNVDNTHSDTSKETSHGTDSLDETDRHYVSAYNQITPANADTYSDRDTIDRDEEHDKVVDDVTNGTWNQQKTSNNTTQDNVDVTNAKDITTDTTSTQDKNQTDNEKTGTKEQEDTHKIGIDRISNQELIDMQRKTVQFNIINWIIDKFAREFIIGVW